MCVGGGGCKNGKKILLSKSLNLLMRKIKKLAVGLLNLFDFLMQYLIIKTKGPFMFFKKKSLTLI